MTSTAAEATSHVTYQKDDPRDPANAVPSSLRKTASEWPREKLEFEYLKLYVRSQRVKKRASNNMDKMHEAHRYGCFAYKELKATKSKLWEAQEHLASKLGEAQEHLSNLEEEMQNQKMYLTPKRSRDNFEAPGAPKKKSLNWHECKREAA